MFEVNNFFPGVHAWHKTVCNLHIITFTDSASASGALQVHIAAQYDLKKNTGSLTR